jgi:hypothetical protein
MKPDAVGIAWLIGFAVCLLLGVGGLVNGNGLGAFGLVCGAIAMGLTGLERLRTRKQKE